MKLGITGPQALAAIDNGQIVYDAQLNRYLWLEVIHDPIHGPTSVIMQGKTAQSPQDIVRGISVAKDPFHESSRLFAIYEPETDSDTLSMHEAYEAMLSGEVVYDVDNPDVYYFIELVSTPFSNVRYTFRQPPDIEHENPEVIKWDARSTGFGRYRIYHITKIEDIQ